MRTARFFLVLVALGCGGPMVRGDGPLEFFEKRVRPVLAEQCYGCHSAGARKLKGGLRVDSRAGLLVGGDNGPALVPGAPEKSRLIAAIRYHDVDLQMPPRAKLPDSAIADLTAWVKAGAPWPEEKKAAGSGTAEFDLARRKQEQWCWRPLQRPAPPSIDGGAAGIGAVDRFVLAKLQEKGLAPAAAADSRTLLRRLYFDLVGLPPPPADVEVFVREASAQPQAALERVVDRLLAAPQFGERWGRHWLDLMRYAESRGHEFDYPAPNAYQYRDYVIRALNADVPYDRFVTEHLAGDLLPAPRRHPREGFNESILGTGFWFLGEQLHSPVDICQDKADRFDNMVDVMSKAFLGLTVACARCHDHKFDAISTRDYYALCGFLESSSYRLVPFDTLEPNRQVAADLERLRADARPALQRAAAAALRPALRQTADYLLAARKWSLASPHSADARALGRYAEEHHLETRVLARWVKHLTRAQHEAQDPLHAWSKGEPSAGMVHPKAAPMVEDADTVVDYGHLRPGEWLPDGFAYGSRPLQPGDLHPAPNGMPLRLQEVAAAELDPAWQRLQPAAGAQLDAGAVGALQRPGLMLRTPSFPIRHGRVYYLVRGTGRAYAAVEAHGMIAGPLHGQLLKGFKTGPGFQWIEHDLSAYQGRLARIEFTPAPDADFAVARVVQADRMPEPLDSSHAPSAQRREGPDAEAPEGLARAYQQLFLDVCERLASDRLRAAGDAALVNWLLRHPELFPLSPGRDTERTQFQNEEKRLLAQIRVAARLAPAMLDGNAVNEPVFIRGNYKTPGETVPRRFLEALAGPQPLQAGPGSGRLELARQLTDPAVNPLLPRVLVNRVWHHLFGRGLVASVDNFGVLGEAPSHPELLDYLAERFVTEGWSLKKLVRALVLTRAYQRSSQPNEAAQKLDPEDRLLQRARVRRLEGEAIRDAVLSVSGRLDLELGGPPVPVHLTEFQQGRGRPESGPLDGQGRRSVYLAVKRNFLAPLLLAFDTPIPFSTVGRRTVSNVPAQALILLNDPFIHQQAQLWARRVLATKAGSAERVRGMYLSAFSRSPDAEELRACLDYVEGKDEVAAWTGLAHALFNAKEFIFLP